jgi:hypothetical protein
VRRAIQQASTRWSGACEPIILVDESGAIGKRDRAIVATGHRWWLTVPERATS